MSQSGLKTLRRDSVELAYVDAGVGTPPLLLIHGWCCDHAHWREQVLAFQDRHWTVAVDLRGHGSSDKPDQDYGIGLFVDDVAWLCNEIGLLDAIVVGHSMGGVIGMNLARRHPGIARALVMVDSPVVPLPPALQGTADAVFAGLGSPAYVDVAKNFVGNFMFRPDSDPELRQTIIEGMATAPQRVMLTALRDTLADDNIAAGPIGMPALYARASTQIASAEEIRNRYPGLEVIDVDAAHFLQMEAPGAFNGVLRGFVERVS